MERNVLTSEYMIKRRSKSRALGLTLSIITGSWGDKETQKRGYEMGPGSWTSETGQLD